MPAESTLRDRLGASDALVETMRFEPAVGLVRLKRHLDRMSASANAFAIPFDRVRAEEALARETARRQPLRVRLTLGRDGRIAASSTPFEPQPGDRNWRLAIARTRVLSSNPLVRHKTTCRSTCEQARAEFPEQEADEIVLLNEHDEVCEGTITNIFVDNGTSTLLTPALDCGLLPGVLRAELLDSGRAKEARIDLVCLRSAPGVFVGNSLRGLIPGYFGG